MAEFTTTLPSSRICLSPSAPIQKTYLHKGRFTRAGTSIKCAGHGRQHRGKSGASWLRRSRLYGCRAFRDCLNRSRLCCDLPTSDGVRLRSKRVGLDMGTGVHDWRRGGLGQRLLFPDQQFVIQVLQLQLHNIPRVHQPGNAIPSKSAHLRVPQRAKEKQSYGPHSRTPLGRAFPRSSYLIKLATSAKKVEAAVSTGAGAGSGAGSSAEAGTSALMTSSSEGGEDASNLATAVT